MSHDTTLLIDAKIIKSWQLPFIWVPCSCVPLLWFLTSKVSPYEIKCDVLNFI